MCSTCSAIADRPWRNGEPLSDGRNATSRLPGSLPVLPPPAGVGELGRRESSQYRNRQRLAGPQEIRVFGRSSRIGVIDKRPKQSVGIPGLGDLRQLVAGLNDVLRPGWRRRWRERAVQVQIGPDHLDEIPLIKILHDVMGVHEYVGDNEVGVGVRYAGLAGVGEAAAT